MSRRNQEEEEEKHCNINLNVMVAVPTNSSKVQIIQNSVQTKPPQMDWRQTQQTKVVSYNEVKHAKTGTLGIEASLQNGQKTLIYTNNKQETLLVNKFDNTNNPGYPKQWERTGETIQASDKLIVKDLQTSSKSGQINLNDANKVNNKLGVNNQKNLNQLKSQNANAYAACSAAGGIAGNLLANCDRMTGEQAVKAVAVGGGMAALTTVAAQKIPFVGPVMTAVSSSIALTQILTNNQLSAREKWADTIRTAVTTVGSIGAGIAGATYGAELGLIGGPVGVGIGMFVGGLIGSLSVALVGRGIERKPLKISVTWRQERYPKVKLENVLDKVRFIYIVAIDRTNSRSPWIAKKALNIGDKDEVELDCYNLVAHELMQQKISLDVYLYQKNPNFTNAGELYDSLANNSPIQTVYHEHK